MQALCMHANSCVKQRSAEQLARQQCRSSVKLASADQREVSLTNCAETCMPVLQGPTWLLKQVCQMATPVKLDDDRHVKALAV